MRVLVVGRAVASMRSPGRFRRRPWSIACSARPAMPASPRKPSASRSARPISRGMVRFCRGERIDFVVVGPEAPLVLGLVDALEAEGIAAFGPSAAASAIEASKAFAKDLFTRAQIPTAAYRRFRDPAAAKAYIASRGAPVVVKADGLAAGKGVVVAEDLDTAYRAVDAALVERRFGTAGLEIVVEDFLAGEEASFFALVDGKDALPLATAQDYKRAGDGDIGPEHRRHGRRIRRARS